MSGYLAQDCVEGTNNILPPPPVFVKTTFSISRDFFLFLKTRVINEIGAPAKSVDSLGYFKREAS